MQEGKMKAYRTIKIRIYPNKIQKNIIETTFDCCIGLRNLMLEELITNHKKTGKLKIFDVKSYINHNGGFKNIDTLAFYSVQFELEEAFKQSVSKGSYPEFVSLKRRTKSYVTTNKFGGLLISKNHLKIRKLGNVRAVVNVDIDSSKVSSIEIRKCSDGTYFAYLTTQKETKYDKKKPIKVLGLDYKSDGLYIDNNGNIGTNHRYFRESEKKIAKIQQNLSRKCGGIKGQGNSNNYNKQMIKLDKAYTKIKNQRKDNLHKISTALANEYDAIVVEDISMVQIVEDKKLNLGKSTYDNGYYTFVKMLEYKLNERGKTLVKINKYFPSTKKCSNCGTIRKMELDDRLYECSNCGLKIDRDLNAAINIKKEGERILGIL